MHISFEQVDEVLLNARMRAYNGYYDKKIGVCFIYATKQDQADSKSIVLRYLNKCIYVEYSANISMLQNM